MTEVAERVPEPVDPLTGTPAARDPYALADLMRRAGATPDILEATAGWLSGERRSSDRTRAGYITDLSRWVAWCEQTGMDPAFVRATDADLFAAAMRDAGLANATRARRLASVSSWFGYLVRADVAGRNPFGAGMDRPKPPKVSHTRGMSEDQLAKFLAYASERESKRTFAVLATMAATACRVSSIIGAQFDDLGEDSGHRTLDMPVKGGDYQRFVLPAFTVGAIDAYLQDDRGGEPGPLYATGSGKPLDQPSLYRTVQRVARGAGIPQWADLSSHGIRHTVLTILHDRGYPTHVIQDLAGHADPRTTRAYDLARGKLDRSPANSLGAIYATGIARYAPAYR